MNERIYNRMEITGYSDKSIEDAIQKAIQKASEDHRNVRWFELTELKGDVCDNLLCNWQVTVKIGYEMK